MKQQSLHDAIPTADLFCQLHHAADEPKFSLRDLMTSTGQVAAVLSACWMVHLFV